MAVMTGLQLNVGQHLKLTPQLQQSIKILQYSALEVQQTIETALQNNFMLEIVEDQDEQISLEENAPESVSELLSSDEEREEATLKELNIKSLSELSTDLDLDCSWQDIYGEEESEVRSDRSETSSLSSIESPPPSSSQSSDEYTLAENYTSAEETLQDKLSWQIEIYPWLTAQQEIIARFIVDQINEEGLLSCSLEHILSSLQQLPFTKPIDTSEIEEVLKIIQTFEPTGVGARSLQETLAIQISTLNTTPFVVTAKQIIENHFEWLSEHDYKRIKKYYALNDEELEKVLSIIQNLNPRPGRAYSSVEQSFVVPDLLLFRTKTGWRIELNQNVFPHLSINKAYIDLSKNIRDEKQSQQIKEQILEAKGLIKSIHSRGETLLKVGEYIIQTQSQFFEKGEQAMQPLVLRDVAEALQLHESTISRATNQKYIQTPRGTYELKYFFSTGVSQYGSEDQSSIAIKSHLKELIQQEEPRKPLSDNKLVQLLEERGITIARRTISKYRESLNIPSSSERKKLYNFRNK